MEIYKRPDSDNFYVDLVDPATKKRRRISLRTTKKIEAQKAAHAKLAELEAAAVLGKDGKTAFTLKGCLDEYVEHIRSQGKPCLASYSYLRDKALGLRPPFTDLWHLDAEKLLHTLSPVDLNNLTRARRAAGNSAQTIAHELKLLRAATRHAAGLGYRVPEHLTNGLTRDPWRMPKLTTKTRYLTRDEFDRLFAYLDPASERACRDRTGSATAYRLADRESMKWRGRQDAQDLLVALAMTGGRWAEVGRLTWRQVNLTEGTIMLWAGKTQAERLASMPDAVRKVLTRRLAESKPGATFIFPGRNGIDGRSKGSCQAVLRAMKACGFNEPELVARHGRCTVHSLRHTFASWLRQGGAGLDEVQRMLGHATLSMTLRYAHLSPASTTLKMQGILNEAMGPKAAAGE